MTLAKEGVAPYGHKLEAGHPLKAVAVAKYGKSEVIFIEPSGPALYLSISNRMSIAVEQAYFGSLKELIGNLPKKRIFLDDTMENTIFEILENCICTIIFSYSAIEAFSNQEIPEDYIYERKQPQGKCVEYYDKKQIERWISLSEKLDKILPVIHDVHAMDTLIAVRWKMTSA